jgi:non-heme chloroperoxidase
MMESFGNVTDAPCRDVISTRSSVSPTAIGSLSGPEANRGLALANTTPSNGGKEIATAFVKTTDAAEIFYKDRGPTDARPMAFHDGWRLSADDWDNQMLFFLSKGYWVVAHDRRGHGRSSLVGEGHDMDHDSADAAAVDEHLGHRTPRISGTGGGEVARYVRGTRATSNLSPGPSIIAT